jgi:type IV secretion system protein VirD4
LVISDPKGEIYRETASVKESQGYKVTVIDFDRKHLSARHNPLDYVRRPEDALTVASAIIANTENPNRPSGGDQSFWDQAEQALITALVLYIKLHRPQQEQNLGSVLSMGAELTQKELNAVFDALPPTDPARKYYRTFRQAEDKVRSSILIGFATRLQLWNLDEIEQLTASSDFDLADIGREKTVLYVIFPLDARARPLMPIMALLWTQLCDELVKLANSQPTGALPVTCRLRIDEAANIGHIPDLELRVSTTRGLGVWWELVFQTLGQFKARYSRTWAEIAGSCDTTLYLGGNDQETVEYISRRLGMTTIQVDSATQSQSRQGNAVEGQGVSYTGRPLMTPDEVAKLPSEKAILLQRSRNPAVVLKAFYKLHPLAEQVKPRPPAERPAPTPVDCRVLNPVDLPAVRTLRESTQKAPEATPHPRERHGRKRADRAGRKGGGQDPLGFLKKEGGQQR